MSDSPADLRCEELMRRAEAFWSERGRRMTTVRRIICETLFRQQGSIDAEQLLRAARESDKLISISTVYRTLSALTDSGLIVEIEGRDGEKNYNVADRETNATSHIVCEDCGQVIPLENPCLSLREAPAARAAGFNPSRISLRFEAGCEQLRKTGLCEHRKP